MKTQGQIQQGPLRKEVAVKTLTKAAKILNHATLSLKALQAVA